MTDRSIVDPETTSASPSLSIERGPFEMIPHWLLTETEISSHAIRLYLVIRSFGDEGRAAWPGRTRLGAMIGQSRSTITRAVRELEEVGALCVHRRPGEIQQSNEYHVHWYPVEDCDFFDRPPADRGRPPLDGGRPYVDGGRPRVDGELILKEPRPKERDSRSIVRKPVDDDPNFERFWQAYPRKAAKGSARRAWSKAVRIVDPEELVAAATRYADDPNREPAYTAHAATWLNGERWLDGELPPRDSRSSRKESEVLDVIARAAARDRGEIES